MIIGSHSSDEARPPPSTPRVRRKVSDSDSSGLDHRNRSGVSEQQQQPPPTPRTQRKTKAANSNNQNGPESSSSTSGASQMTKPSSLTTTGKEIHNSISKVAKGQSGKITLTYRDRLKKFLMRCDSHPHLQ